MLLTKVQTKQDILDEIAVSHEAFARLGVKSIGMFGSFVKNTVKENSDVDMLVDFIPGKKSFDNFMELVF